jgi:hypothetical protein
MSTTISRLEYIKNAFKSKLYLDRNWILSVFSLTNFGNKKLENVIHRGETYSYFCDGAKDEIIITDAPKDAPLFSIYDKIEVLFGFIESIEAPTVTTLGNLLFNACVVDYAFGSKLGYLNDKKTANVKYIESVIAKRLVSGNKPENDTDKNKLYVDEYLRFVEGFAYLQGFNFNWVACVSEKLLTVPPNNVELKKNIVEQVGDKIGQPSVLAGVYKTLDDNDKEFLKDDSSAPFMNGKIRVARRKMFLIQGGEGGLEGGDSYEVATNSLAEGIEVSKFAINNNVLRAGSLFRGQETQLGGVATKEMIRATSNIRIVKNDCGTTMGKVVLITEQNYVRQLVGLSIVTPEGTVLIEEESVAKSYLGKTVMRRSTQYCKSTGENFCEVCAGKRLALHPTGVSMAITEIGGALLGIFMSMMHAKELKVHKVSLNDVTR